MHAQESFGPHDIYASTSHVSKHGVFFFEVQAVGLVHATPQQAWRVLTDYERLDEFVPDLMYSRVLSRERHEAILEQQSRAGFLILSRTFHIVVRIQEHPFSALDVIRLSGDMRHYAAHWTLEPVEEHGVNGTRITFRGEIEPDFLLPPLIGDAIVQANMKKMFEAVVGEIERRSAH